MRDIRLARSSWPFSSVALGLALVVLLLMALAFGLRTSYTPPVAPAAPAASTAAPLNRRPLTFADGKGSSFKPCYASSERCGTVTPLKDAAP